MPKKLYVRHELKLAVEHLRTKGRSAMQIQEELGISRRTYYRCLEAINRAQPLAVPSPCRV